MSVEPLPAGADGGHAQIVDNEHTGFLDALEELGEAAVSVSLLEGAEELGSGKIMTVP